MLDIKAPTRKWSAQWIWPQSLESKLNVYGYFRKNFESKGDIQGARLYITAEKYYQVFINGRRVGRGPASSYPYHYYYDVYALEDFLCADTNTISVIVNHLGTRPYMRGGLLVEAVDADGQVLVCSDATWRCEQAAPWATSTHKVGVNKQTPFQENYDARLEPEGWHTSDFDDSSWPHPGVVRNPKCAARPPSAGPWSKLLERDIPFMEERITRAEKVLLTEESLELRPVNHSRAIDLSVGLSLVGQPIQYSRLEAPENLCQENAPTVIQGSQNHHDLDFDGIYAPAVVLDFGRIINARARIRLSGPAGGRVEVGYTERLIDGRFNLSVGVEFADAYTMKDGEQTYESFTWKPFRYLKLRFCQCAGPVTIHDVAGAEFLYPFEEKGGFSSSDERLNAIFKISKDTAYLCCNESILDTPWREQSQWLGDAALVTVPLIESCFGETTLVRKFLFQSGNNPNPTGILSNISNFEEGNWLLAIPDYSLWWIHCLCHYYRYTGDESLLHRLYPQALRILDAHIDYINEDGLVEDMPYWPFIDTADIDRRGVCTAYNAIFYATLERLACIAEWRGDRYTVGLCNQLRDGILANFDRVLYDPKRGCYADANIDGELSEWISEQSNMASIWAGLRSGAAATELIETVYGAQKTLTFTEAQPFFMAIVLSALDQCDAFALALELIRRRWGRRMVDKGATSTYEEWHQNGTWKDGKFVGFMRSNSHSWSACPGDFLIRNLLGVQILEPGCSKVRVSPRKTDFDYQVTFPTPLGPIEARCEKGELSVTAPDAIELVREEPA